jgi:hypothetical protein
MLIASYCSAWVPQQRASLERPQPLHRHRPHLRMQTCVSDITTANPHRRRAFLRAIPCSIAAVAAVSSTRSAVAANLVEDLTTTAPALTLRDRVAKKLVDFPAGGSTACNCFGAHRSAAQCSTRARCILQTHMHLHANCSSCPMLAVLFTVLMSCSCAAFTAGLDTTDVYYPAYFKGTWECKSITREVEAPVGIDLFGGNRYYSVPFALFHTDS